MAGETTPSGSTSNSVQPSASTEQVASQSIQSNTDRLGQIDVQGLVNSVKASSPDVQTQRDVAASAAKQIEDRGVRREFVKALEDQGVARKPGFWERQWQGVKGTATGLYEGGASLVEGVYDLGKLGVQGTVATAKFGYNYATDGQYRAETNAAIGRAADATIDATKQGLTAAKDYAAERIADPSKLVDDAKTVDAAVRSGADAVAKKADQLYDSYDKARSEAVIQGTTDELGGKIVGRAAFEIGTAVVPVSKLGIAGKGAAAAADAQKAIKGADAAVDATRVARGVDTASDAGKAVKAGDEVIDAANRALVRGGDDPARVARVEQEARAAAGDGATGGASKTAQETAAAERAQAEVAAANATRVERFDNVDDFNRATNAAKPNTTYEFGTYRWTTDESGRVASVEGQVDLTKHGRLTTDGVDTTSIGKGPDAKSGDVGFHLVGDQFNGPVNRLNVVPGNGVSQGDLKSLNLSGYKRWENQVADLAKNNQVEMRIETMYDTGNLSTRPDAFNAMYRVNGGDWIETSFMNKAGG